MANLFWLTCPPGALVLEHDEGQFLEYRAAPIIEPRQLQRPPDAVADLVVVQLADSLPVPEPCHPDRSEIENARHGTRERPLWIVVSGLRKVLQQDQQRQGR